MPFSVPVVLLIAAIVALAAIAAVRVRAQKRITATAPSNAPAAIVVVPPAVIVVDDDMADLLPGYVERQRQSVAALEAMLQRGDLVGIRQLGHRMKGSGAGYGLNEISRVGRLLEETADAGDHGSIRELLAELRTYLSTLNIRSADGRSVVRS